MFAALMGLGGSTASAIGLAVGWMVLSIAIAIGVATFASTHLEGVVRTVEQDFSRSFWTGAAGQLALTPVLGLLVAALALSVVGALAIPIAIVAFLTAIAGMGTLGFLATAQLTGGAFVPSTLRATLSARRVARRALLAGVLFYTGLWVVAAGLTAVPLAAGISRGIAFAATWVAVTAGFGAVILSRAGTRTPPGREATPTPADDYAWSTPTPITGVAAARRPAPTRGYSESA